MRQARDKTPDAVDRRGLIVSNKSIPCALYGSAVSKSQSAIICENLRLNVLTLGAMRSAVCCSLVCVNLRLINL